MKVECIENSADNWADSLSSLGYTAESQFDMAIGKVYTVYAICLWGEALHYLLEAVAGRPAWYPAVLFEVRNTTMPSSWHFAYWGRDRSNVIKAVWGYEELIGSEGHFDALSEQDQEAIRIFGQRKSLITED